MGLLDFFRTKRATSPPGDVVETSKEPVSGGEEQEQGEPKIVVTAGVSVGPPKDPPGTTTPALRTYGTTDPVCPSCGSGLKKKPARKTNCPACTEPIYVRTRPVDRRKVLLRDSELEEQLEQQSIADGTYVHYCEVRASRDSYRAELRDELQRPPTFDEVMLRLEDARAEEEAKIGHWSLYAVEQLAMVRDFTSTLSPEQKIRRLSRFLYLDGVNGLQPTSKSVFDGAVQVSGGGFAAQELRADNRTVADILKAMKKGRTDLGSVREWFLEEARVLHERTDAPISPDESWLQVAPLLRQDG